MVTRGRMIQAKAIENQKPGLELFVSPTAVIHAPTFAQLPGYPLPMVRPFGGRLAGRPAGQALHDRRTSRLVN